MWLTASCLSFCMLLGVAIYGASMLTRLYYRFTLEYLVKKGGAILSQQRQGMVIQALLVKGGALELTASDFMRSRGYWPKIYMGIFDCGRVAALGGNFWRAGQLFKLTLRYHPFFTAALQAMGAVYKAQGRLGRAAACSEITRTILRGDFHAGWPKEYRLCVQGF